MSTLYIEFSDAAEADRFVDSTPGFEFVEGGHVTEAIYGDDLVDASGPDGLWPADRVQPRRGTASRTPTAPPQSIFKEDI